ncbi:phosphoadenosine phosphosulfate reductase family protein [Pseudomonas sp. GOM6]|uniref:phosphoadenosine phosphosulfate reductase family protein n=1 Tax=Pseudomonas sp. GOM6 TaxID=3036944 RepID=UPI00240A4275|nr:phosphoadenosine phosphosulfate reductase family protein [Pseudomonas sp. GOM6]MDG1581067.1 phosphoadenosine phosphosulfate reductase family protein [Pseudomonas sp. GOM6]
MITNASAAQIELLDLSEPTFPITPALAAKGKPNSVSLTPEVTALLDSNCVVAIGVSGGKDSDACAIAVSRHLDAIGHTGPKVLIHACLGVVEWRESLDGCRRLAAHLGWELLVVSRKAGGLMERWESRWESNVQRFEDLACVKLILPWSTPALRFCTSELKGDLISAELKKRFPGQAILNVTGVRRQESTARSKMAVSGPVKKLQRKNAAGVFWNAIIDWPVEDVVYAIVHAGLPLHEAYTRYGMSRVSCTFCIMSAIADLQNSTTCPDNQSIYIRMCRLELKSGFAFQGNRWLCDVAPHLLPDELRAQIPAAKAKAAKRVEIEATIPAHMLFSKGWPEAVPSWSEAVQLAEVRSSISELMGFQAQYTTPQSIIDRYTYLIEQRAMGVGIQKATRRAA